MNIDKVDERGRLLLKRGENWKLAIAKREIKRLKHELKEQVAQNIVMFHRYGELDRKYQDVRFQLSLRDARIKIQDSRIAELSHRVWQLEP